MEYTANTRNRPPPSGPSRGARKRGEDARGPPTQPRQHLSAKEVDGAQPQPPTEPRMRAGPRGAVARAGDGAQVLPTGPRDRTSLARVQSESKRESSGAEGVASVNGLRDAPPTGPRSTLVATLEKGTQRRLVEYSGAGGKTGPSPPRNPAAVRSDGPPTEPRNHNGTKRKRLGSADGPSARQVEALTPWVDSPENTHEGNKLQRLHREIVEYVLYMGPTAQERTARQYLFNRITRAFKARFRDAEVVLFGSVAHDVCLPHGDIDIVVRAPTVQNSKRFLFQLSDVIRDTGIADTVLVKHWTRVPVMSFTSSPACGSFRVDVSLNKDDGMLAVPLVKRHLDTMPALRSLLMLLKLFLAQRELNSAATAGVSGYVLTCMCISFLQLNPDSLPTEHVTDPLGSESLGTLFLGFLKYYGTDFPYATSYISVTEGKLLPKAGARWIVDEKRGSPKLAVQCLVRSDNDIAKSAGKIEVVRAAFREAHQILSEISDDGNEDDMGAASMLGTIMWVTVATVRRREELRRMVDSGRMEDTSGTLAASSGSRRSNVGSREDVRGGRSLLDRVGRGGISDEPRLGGKRGRHGYAR